MKSKRLAPIALFVYNRPNHTKKVMEALRKNKLAKKSELFIFSDAAKSEKAEPYVKEVRNYIKKINGFKKIHIIELKKNYGLAKSLISGITKVINKYGKIIVLEDDIVVSKYFLEYMNEALDLYEDEEQVWNVCGYLYPFKQKDLPDSFFLKFFSCWGWGTWKRAWKNFESNGLKLLQEIEKKGLKREFDVMSSYPYFRMLKRQVQGKNNSWAVRWYATCFLNNKFCLYPGRSLVQNIGFDASGTHGNPINWFDTKLSDRPIRLKKEIVKENLYVLNILIDYYNNLRPKRVIRKLKSLFFFRF